MKKLFTLLFIISSVYAAEPEEDKPVDPRLMEIAQDVIPLRGIQVTPSQAALVAGAVSLGTPYARDAICEHIMPYPTRSPSMIIDFIPTAIQIGITLVSTYAAARIFHLIRQGVEMPFAVQVQKIEDENRDFKDAIIRNQKTYEEHLRLHVQEEIQGAQKTLAQLWQNWFERIDTISEEAQRLLKEQQEEYEKVQGRIPVDLKEDIARIIAKGQEGKKKLGELHAVPEKLVQKYTQDKNPVKRFFHQIFQKKQKIE